jgi:hypothetical protein
LTQRQPRRSSARQDALQQGAKPERAFKKPAEISRSWQSFWELSAQVITTDESEHIILHLGLSMFNVFPSAQRSLQKMQSYRTRNWEVDHDRMARYRQDVVHGIWA